MLRSLMLLLLLPALANCQTVTLPADMTTKAGKLVPFPVTYDGDDFQYDASDGLTLFRQFDPDPKKVSLMLYVDVDLADGVYVVTAAACKANKMGKFAKCKVTVGSPGPGPFDKKKAAVPVPDTAIPPCKCGCMETGQCKCKNCAERTADPTWKQPPPAKNVPQVKTAPSPCSPYCSCGCNDGQACTCPKPRALSVQVAPVRAVSASGGCST